MMSKRIFILLCTLAASSAIMSLGFERKNAAAMEGKNSILARQQEQIQLLALENQGRSNQLAQATPSSTHIATNQIAELNRLRSQVEALRRQTNELASQLVQSSLQKQPVVRQTVLNSEEQRQSRVRGLNGVAILKAIQSYIQNHNNEAPSNLEQLADILKDIHMGDNKYSDSGYTFVYHGSVERLNGIPLSCVAIIRSPVSTTPDGQLVCMYGFLGGSVMTKRFDSADDLLAYEALHVIHDRAQGN